jgi:hypothetical protein
MNNSTSFVGLLTIAFIVLKIIHAIQWSWLWVLSPIWISALFSAVVGIIVLLIGLATVLKDRHKIY